MKTKINIQTEITYLNETITLTGGKQELIHVLTYLTNTMYDASELASKQGYPYTSKTYLEFRKQITDRIEELKKIPD